MANAKRAANRAASKAGFRTGTSGSPLHTETSQPMGGNYPGAGEVGRAGPNKMALKSGSPNIAVEKSGPGSPPAGMKKYTEE